MSNPIDTLAILGGQPAFPEGIAIIRPCMDEIVDEVLPDVEHILRSNMLTNVNQWVPRFEQAVEASLGVEHAVAVSTCTSGLILVLRAWGIDDSEVVMPSFTFSASAHAVDWTGNRPRFADIDPDTWTVDVDAVRRMVTPETRAILPVHLFGHPAPIVQLEALADELNLKLLFDAAHGLGGTLDGRKIGTFGDAEVFSLSPTKIITTMEGGLITTSDGDLAEKLRTLRNYGNLPDYTCPMIGLNARMPELNARLGIAMMERLDDYVAARNLNAMRLRADLAEVPGITFQRLRTGVLSTWKDLCFTVDPQEYGLTRDELREALAAEGAATKTYFDPPVHHLKPYADSPHDGLALTEHVAANIIAIPLHNRMTEQERSSLAGIIRHLHERADEVKDKLR